MIRCFFCFLAPGQPEPEKDYAESARGPINFGSRAGERLVIDEPRSVVCRATIKAVWIGCDDLAKGKSSITKSSAYWQMRRGHVVLVESQFDMMSHRSR
jgi:hypothetical protein